MTLPKTQINCIFKFLVQYFRLLWTIIELVQFSECNAQFLNFLMQFIKISSSQCTYYLEWVRALYWCMEPADWLMHRFTANLAARLEEALGSAESYPWFANFNASSTLSNNISLSPDPKQCQFFSQPTALWQNQIFTWPSFHSPNPSYWQAASSQMLTDYAILLFISTFRKGKANRS